MYTNTKEESTDTITNTYDNYHIIENYSNRRPYIGYRWDDVHMILGERHYGEKYQDDYLLDRILKDTGFNKKDVRNKFMDNWGWYVGLKSESVEKKFEEFYNKDRE